MGKEKLELAIAEKKKVQTKNLANNLNKNDAVVDNDEAKSDGDDTLKR